MTTGFKRPERTKLARLKLTPGEIRRYQHYAEVQLNDAAGGGGDAERAILNLASMALTALEDLVAARADRERLDLLAAKGEDVLHDLYYALYPPPIVAVGACDAQEHATEAEYRACPICNPPFPS